jgi:hypothetical protein
MSFNIISLEMTTFSLDSYPQNKHVFDSSKGSKGDDE